MFKTIDEKQNMIVYIQQQTTIIELKAHGFGQSHTECYLGLCQTKLVLYIIITFTRLN